MRGDRVTLRPVEAGDHPLLQAWQNDPEIAAWMDYPLPFSARDIDEDQERTRREGHAFTIVHEGRPVGKCGLNHFRWRVRLCALYVYLGDREVWGRGLGREAVRLLLDLGFDELGMERIELMALADNTRALRLYRACGFEVEGVLRGRAYRAGRWHDMTVMSVRRDERAAPRKEPGA